MEYCHYDTAGEALFFPGWRAIKGFFILLIKSGIIIKTTFHGNR